MAGVDVCVVCNSDAETASWSTYIVGQASSTSSPGADVRSRILLDTELSQPSSVDALRTSRVVVVVVSLGHLDYLRRCPVHGQPVYGACSPEHSLILVCGVSDDAVSTVSHQFPRYSSWQRVHHDVEQSVLAETLKTLMSGAEPVGVQLLQTTARCEEETLMVLSFSKELPSSSTVDVVLSNAADKDEASTEEIVATRVNPYTYSFDAPSDHKLGEVNVEVRVDKRAMASLSMTYVSVGPLIAIVTQVYMHLLNTVCGQLVPPSGPGPTTTKPPSSLSVSSLDQKLSSLLDEDLTSTVPAQAFEQLFGAHRYDVDTDKEFELPTLIHFAAKFGFKELCAKLIDLPDASYVGRFTNCNGQQPNHIAQANRHSELCHFLESFLEMEKEFQSMYISYYNDKGDTVPGGGRYQNTTPNHQPIDESLYVPMDGRRRQINKDITAIEEDVEETYATADTDYVPLEPRSPTVAVPSTRPMRGAVSASQQELIDIMGLVKAKNISQAKAEEMFREWKTKHEGRHAKSFREKQEHLAKMNEAVRQVKSETQATRQNFRLSDSSVSSDSGRSSTASRASNLSISGIEIDYEEPPVVAPRLPVPRKTARH